MARKLEEAALFGAHQRYLPNVAAASPAPISSLQSSVNTISSSFSNSPAKRRTIASGLRALAVADHAEVDAAVLAQDRQAQTIEPVCGTQNIISWTSTPAMNNGCCGPGRLVGRAMRSYAVSTLDIDSR